MKRGKSVMMVSAILVSACSPGPRYWIGKGLRDAGLPRPVAACMADRLVDHYSWEEVRRIELAPLRAIQAADVDSLLGQAGPLLPVESYEILAWAGRSCAHRR